MNKALKTIWFLLTLILVYGILPVTIPDFTDDYNKSNTILIERQECGCPCPEAVIVKGKLAISSKMRAKYPELGDNYNQINLVNFPPFDDISSDEPHTFDFANYNSFKITGEVVGIDTIFCTPQACEIAPIFKLEKWNLVNYVPKFQNANILVTLAYFGLWILFLPILAIITIVKYFRKNNSN